MKNKILVTFFALAFAVCAFADTIPNIPASTVPDHFDPKTGKGMVSPTPAPNPLEKELADAKAQLAQLQTTAQTEINRLSVLAERNELVFRLQAAQTENLALRNALAQEQAKTLDLQSRYDMEKAKVEAMLKAHPADVVRAESKPAAPAPAAK